MICKSSKEKNEIGDAATIWFEFILLNDFG